MVELASRGQLRSAFLRWALLLVPGVLLLGILSGALAGNGRANAWFEGLVKPSLYPPPATFGLVWSVLYVAMGLALAVVVAARGARWRRAAIGAFAAQFVLNLAWSPLFFAAHKMAPALALLVLLDVAVLITTVLFARVRPLAGWLLAPYFAWALFATLLNWQFVAANPNQQGKGATVRVEI